MDFSVTILGSSSALPIYGRNQTSQIVKHNSSYFMIDCGEATQIQVSKYKQKLHKIHHIFISHLHGDHYFGLIGLVSSMHLHGRTKTLYIYGQKGLDEILISQFKYSQTVLKFEIVFRQLNNKEPELIYDNNGLTIESIPLNHGIPCCGFVFREKEHGRSIVKEKIPDSISVEQFGMLREGKDIQIEGKWYPNQDLTIAPDTPKSYAFCSDNRITKDLEGYLKNITLLYHEATFLEDKKDRAIQTRHTTAKEVGQLAEKIATKKLIIGHFSARYKNLSPIFMETKNEFDNVELAEEGKTYRIG